MTKYAVVVDGLCDCSTVVVVEDAEDVADAHAQAMVLAGDLPTDQWYHGEITVGEPSEELELSPTAMRKASARD